MIYPSQINLKSIFSEKILLFRKNYPHFNNFDGYNSTLLRKLKIIKII